jgi:hypothetical protein
MQRMCGQPLSVASKAGCDDEEESHWQILRVCRWIYQVSREGFALESERELLSHAVHG